MRASTSPLAASPSYSYDSLHSYLQALECFGVPFVCYGGNGSRLLASPDARKELESCGGPNTIERCDALAREEIFRRAPRGDTRGISCVRVAAADVAGSELAVFMTRGHCEGIAAVVVLKARRLAMRDAAELSPLSTRERQVAQLIALGFATKAAAARLGISVHTARHHIERVYAKLGVHTRAEIARALMASSSPPGRGGSSIEALRPLCDAGRSAIRVVP